VSNRRRIKSYEKGLTELTHVVASLAASDMQGASNRIRKTEKLLGRTPLTLLLSAQIARTQGDDAKTQALLEQMLDHKETEYLAARSLSDSAKKQNLPAALALAQRAHAINPQGIAKLLSLQIKTGAWQQAITAIDQSARKRQITRTDMQHYKGIVYLQQGLKSLELGQTANALAATRYVQKFLPDFTPAAIFCAKTFAAADQQSKAIQIISKRWKDSPEAPLAETFLAIIAAEPKDKQWKLVRKLIALNPESREGELLLAQTALRHRDWATARKALTSAVSKLETVRTCQLRAELEKGQYSDADASSKWITRSTNAIADAAWICSSCGVENAHWNTHCSHCEDFDTLKWKQRFLKFVG
jgi:HemY protein